MKKLLWWSLVSICSLIILVLILGTVYEIIITENLTSDETINTLSSCLFCIFLFSLGLWYGIKKLKRKTEGPNVVFTKVIDLKLKGKIEYKDYRNLLLGLTFKKPKYAVIIFALIMVFSNKSILHNFNESSLGLIYLAVFPIVFLVVIPLLTINNINKIYNSNKSLKEELQYHITNDFIDIKGETVSSTQKWEHFIKVVETKHFFMFYQDKIIATFIDKKMFKEDELELFKQFVASLKY